MKNFSEIPDEEALHQLITFPAILQRSKKIPSMSKVKKVANLNTPNSVSLPQTRAFTLERSLSTKKLTNPPKGDKGIE